MAFVPDVAGESIRSPRQEQRRQQDKKRMAYRRAIEDYREEQALRAQVGDFPEAMLARRTELSRPSL